MSNFPVNWLSPRSGLLANARLRWWAVYAAVLTLCFVKPLVELVALALDQSAYSHLILIPLITAGLLRRPLYSISSEAQGSWPIAVGFGATACLLLVLGLVPFEQSQDSLSLQISAYLLLLWAGGFVSLGVSGMRRILFPVLFSLFFIPMPTSLVSGIEHLLQRGSAEAANLMFLVSGETFLREGLVFHLPGLAVEVAQECSGIRSTLVLVITGILAARVLLTTRVRRVVLVSLLLPIAILRNGFRVWLLATLTVHVDPEIIHSALHRHGGPLFFALSLGVVLGCAWLLMRSERRMPRLTSAVAES